MTPFIRKCQIIAALTIILVLLILFAVVIHSERFFPDAHTLLNSGCETGAASEQQS